MARNRSFDGYVLVSSSASHHSPGMSNENERQRAETCEARSMSRIRKFDKMWENTSSLSKHRSMV
ncbi:hypothetical protein EXIGLDRAFT_725343 [Exidia glandulosa HHB12029]|uniref:Uncharacterized protein n=1 Tax=Exidia glandulosa HHB12029 TaxID=1314781 RepID=A0A165MK33_EXIGL|nr:hypothetical protein EXIGLDRAFT_725343 [Exidia glandulosa HHB12029]